MNSRPVDSLAVLLLLIGIAFRTPQPVQGSAAADCRQLNTTEECSRRGANPDERVFCRWKVGGDRRGCFLLSSSSSSSGPTHAVVDVERESHETCGIRLTIETMDLADVDSRGFCMEDYVSIDYCVPEGGARFCGNKSHGTYEYPFETDALSFRLVAKMASSSGVGTVAAALLVRYVLLTDCRIQRQSLYWLPQVSTIPDIVPNRSPPPCSAEIRGVKGSFNSPWYPEGYPPNVDCVYRIFRNSSKVCRVSMVTRVFETEGAAETTVGPACSDFLHAPGCGFVCGSLRFTWVAKFQPGASSLALHFHSDGESEGRGFDIEFEQQECNEGE